MTGVERSRRPRVESLEGTQQRRSHAADGRDADVGAEIMSTGMPLSPEMVAAVGGRMAADLSGVRIHTSSDSEKAAEELGARAFTIGQDIHFNRGEYDPSSGTGRELLEHEVAHAVQNRHGGARDVEVSE